jgi:general secretion pathway protein E
MLGLRLGETVHEPRGCERCGGTGYRGRVGVFEVIETTEPVRQLITQNTNSGTIERAARDNGVTSMIDDAVLKCRAGITSAAEVLRVTTVW